MSSRRNGSVSRAAEAASKSRLHMDRNPQHSRITDPSNPAGRRKEIDNVMKRARQASPGSWDRKLLEVEEKDPGRWRHTGYKQMYLKSRSSSPRSPRRSRSPPPRRSRTPLARRSRSPLARRTRSPLTRRSRSPIRRSPPPRRSRSPVVRRSRSPRRESRSPRRSPRRSPIRRTPPPRRAIRPRSPPPRRPSPRPKPRPPPPRTAVRPPSPPQPPPQGPSSGSGSSVSTCSDESCSVCSAKNKKGPPREPPKPPKGVVIKPRAPSGSPGRSKRPPPPGAPPRAVQPTRELLKAREASKRSREEKVLEWQRSQLNVARPPIPPQHIKREGERRRRGVSPAAIAAALASGSDEESEPNIVPPPRLTLSERFGKMAAWSAARSARLENMRITRRDSALHVHIEGAEAPAREEMEEAPVGSYPEELLAVAPAGLSWDDVRVRYDYYKKRGYLRGLTLSDYVKWEDWWYKYQEWLKRERAYERWAEGEVGSVRRERRRRGGRHRRS